MPINSAISPAASAAQELLLLGPDPRAYLDIERIVSLAKRRGIVAIHPGWGFASEDDTFLAKQKKIVLRNCGIIDPTSLDEYIAADGYKAIKKAIKEYKQYLKDEAEFRVVSEDADRVFEAMVDSHVA